MFKALKSASLVTAIAAAAFIVLAVLSYMRTDLDKDKIVSRPSALDAFKSGNHRSQNDGDAPLVKQAQALSLKWNPPAPVQTVLTSRPVIVPKFKLIGTCYNIDNPEKSRAFIDDPGKGMRWVQINDQIGAAQIIEIADGRIRFKDGNKTEEMATEKSSSSVAGLVSPMPLGPAASLTSQPAKAISPAMAETAVANTETIAMTAEETPDPATLKKQALENVEFVKQLMSDLKDPNKTGVSSDEAAELSQLGDFLKQLETEASSFDSNAQNAAPAESKPETKPEQPDPKQASLKSDKNSSPKPDLNAARSSRFRSRRTAK